jgi:hypothetical protein
MLAARNVFLLLCLTIAMVSCGHYVGVTSSGRAVTPLAISGTDGPPSGSPTTTIPGTQRDLFGNEVDTAVNDYRIDAEGEIYERHSPTTMVAKLGASGV